MIRTGASTKLPCTFAQIIAKTGTNHVHLPRLAKRSHVPVKSGTASACGRGAGGPVATRSPDNVSRAAVRDRAPARRQLE